MHALTILHLIQDMHSAAGLKGHLTWTLSLVRVYRLVCLRIYLGGFKALHQRAIGRRFVVPHTTVIRVFLLSVCDVVTR